MSFEAIRIAVSEHFLREIEGSFNKSRVMFGDNREPLNVDDGSWIRIENTITFVENAEIGTSFQRVYGNIHAQIFTEALSGEKPALELVDLIVRVFQNREFDGVVCFTTTPFSVGREGNYYQMNAQTPFEYQIFS